LGGADRCYAMSARLKAYRQSLANVRLVVDNQYVQWVCNHPYARWFSLFNKRLAILEQHGCQANEAGVDDFLAEARP